MGTLDVIIVGAGTAGLGALREVRKRTQSFMIINDGPWGTMCARAGGMPSKALLEAAERRDRFPGERVVAADCRRPGEARCRGLGRLAARPG